MKKPKIRFKGFRGEWEEHSLAETEFSIIAGGDIDRTIFKKCGNYPVIANAITYDGILGYYENSYRVKGPAVTVTGRGEVGVAVPRHYSFTPVVRLLAIKSSHNVHVLANAINLCKVPIESTGVPQLTTSKLQEYNVFMPQTLDEEDKLASYFQHLDSLIQSTTKKIETLKQVKAASLQSMFPQEGETTPRVRFKGFEGEWERKKFCELYETSTFKNRTFGVDRIISVANMYFKPVSYISNDEYLKSYNVMRLGDIAFEGNKSREFAHGRFVENTIGDGIVSHVFIVMRPISEHYDLQFWKYLINYERIMGPILLRSTKHSTMMTDLVVSDFLKESILVPSYEEQKAIGAFFENLDIQITLQRQRLEKLKQIKSACLDNMFV